VGEAEWERQSGRGRRGIISMAHILTIGPFGTYIAE
jgi:hypothetical protein